MKRFNEEILKTPFFSLAWHGSYHLGSPGMHAQDSLAHSKILGYREGIM